MAGKKVLEAVSNHRKYHFNCAQSVVLPFCDQLGLDKETAIKAMEGFGGGMGGYNLTCGALSAAVFVTSLYHSNASLLNGPITKRDTYKLCSEVTSGFISACGSDCCRVIRGIETGKPLKTCDECIATAAALAEKALAKPRPEVMENK